MCVWTAPGGSWWTATYTGRDYAEYSRLPLYEAVSDVPSITVNQDMSQEQAVIELQSLYAVTPMTGTTCWPC